jgi:hypothetical protein
LSGCTTTRWQSSDLHQREYCEAKGHPAYDVRPQGCRAGTVWCWSRCNRGSPSTSLPSQTLFANDHSDPYALALFQGRNSLAGSLDGGWTSAAAHPRGTVERLDALSLAVATMQATLAHPRCSAVTPGKQMVFGKPMNLDWVARSTVLLSSTQRRAAPSSGEPQRVRASRAAICWCAPEQRWRPAVAG